tara:strand:+ start:218 stop:454 length:237 start_codon:yes stop_codon:yes gene_type:complete
VVVVLVVRLQKELQEPLQRLEHLLNPLIFQLQVEAMVVVHLLVLLVVQVDLVAADRLEELLVLEMLEDIPRMKEMLAV